MNKCIITLNLICLSTIYMPAQTATDLNEGLTVDFESSGSSGMLSWWGRSNRAYFIMTSDDLLTPWKYAPVIEVGSDLAISWGFGSTSDKGFFRLKYTDQFMFDVWSEDLDGDSVTNMDELLQESDPFQAADIDQNGLLDDWELFHGITSASGDVDQPTADGLANNTESLIGSNPEKSYQSTNQIEVFKSSAQ